MMTSRIHHGVLIGLTLAAALSALHPAAARGQASETQPAGETTKAAPDEQAPPADKPADSAGKDNSSPTATPPLPGAAAPRPLANDPRSNSITANRQMRTRFGLTETTLVKAKALTTLAPDNRGQYASLLRAGENALKIRQYIQATNDFTLANYISPRSPETLVSLANADFGREQYAMMAYHLRLAIKFLPELPCVNLQLRRFYRNPEEFIDLRTKLITRTRLWPRDAKLWLVLAYVQWFDDNTAEAVAALRTALQTSTDPALTVAIEQFWEGCVSTGKAGGPLLIARPTSRPAPKAEPQSPQSEAKVATTAKQEQK